MRYVLAVLLILFASYADIFLFRIGIVSMQPSSFFIPLFLILAGLKYSVKSYFDLFKSHSFRFLAVILIFSVIYSVISPATFLTIKTNISLDLITVLLYIFAVQFFRTEPKWLVFIVLLLAFLILTGSVIYDFMFGLPKFNVKLADAVRKGGFGENPNQAASGIKFLALGVLVFLSKLKVKKYLLIIGMVIGVFLTFSRSGLISVILILIFGIANNWSTNLKITTPVLFKSFFNMAILFTGLFLGLVFFADIIKDNFPAFTRGAAGERIDLLTGKSEGSVISEDLGSGGGRGDLLYMYFEKFMKKPFGYGTGYTSDSRYSKLNTHNYYLFLMVNYGFLAFILYIVYLRIGIKLALKEDKFYYLIFIALLIFEGLISHSIYIERSLLISLAFFDSLIYKKKSNIDLTKNSH